MIKKAKCTLALLLIFSMLGSFVPVFGQGEESSAEPTFVGGAFGNSWDVHHYSDFTVDSSETGTEIDGYNSWRYNKPTQSYCSSTFQKDGENGILQIKRSGKHTSNERPFLTLADNTGAVVGLTGKVNIGMKLKVNEASDKPFTVVVRDSSVSSTWANGNYIMYLSFAAGGALSSRRGVADENGEKNTSLGTYPTDGWFELEIKADTQSRTYDVYIDGTKKNETPLAFYFTNTTETTNDNNDISVVELDIQKEGTKGTWLADDVCVWKDRAAELEKAKNSLIDSIISTESLTNVSKNLNLVDEIEGCKVQWASSNGDVITNKGIVTPQKEDAQVKLTATISAVSAGGYIQKAESVTKIFDVNITAWREKVEESITPSVKDGSFSPAWEVYHYSNFTVNSSGIGSSIRNYNNWDHAVRANATLFSTFIMDPEKLNNYLLKINRIASSSSNERPMVVLRDSDTNTLGITEKVSIGMRLKVADVANNPFTVVIRDSKFVNTSSNGNYMMYLSFSAGGALSARRGVEDENGKKNNSLGTYPTDDWFELVIEADTESRTYDVYIDGEKRNTDKLAFYYTDTTKDNGDISVVELDIQRGGTKGTWYADDVCIWKDREEELTALADSLTAESISAEALSEITSDLTLPADTSGKNISWTSDNTDAVNDSGKVTQRNYTQKAKLTARIAYSDTSSLVQNAALSKSFDLQIKKNDSATEDETLSAVAQEWLTDERISYESLTKITKHLRILPTEAPDGVTISWASDKTGIITNDGLVTRPAIGQQDETVTLTATLSKAGAQDVTKPFTLTVKAMPTAQEVLDKAEVALDLSLITYEKKTSIKNKLYFIDRIEGADITWSSNPSGVILDDGTVVRGDTNIDVVLTAKLSYGGVERDVPFELKVIKSAQKTMDEDFDAISIPSTLIKDYNLDKTGSVNMNTITWTSGNTDVIRISNYVAYVTRPEFTDGDKTVTLTAKITLEGVTQSRDFIVTVTKLPSDEELVNNVYSLIDEAYITTEDPSAITKNLALQNEFDGGVTVDWTSNNDSVIDENGNVTNPAIGGSSATVTLTAKIYKRDAERTNTFTFTVKPFETEKEVVERAMRLLTFDDISSEPIQNVSETLNLMSEWKFGTNVSWSVSGGYLNISQSGGNMVALVTPPAYGSGAQKTQLVATVSYGTYSDSKVFNVTVEEEKAYTQIFTQSHEEMTIGAAPETEVGSYEKLPANTPATIEPDPKTGAGKVVQVLKPAGKNTVSGADYFIYYAPWPSEYEGVITMGGRLYMPSDFPDNYLFYELMGQGGVQIPIRFYNDGTVRAVINEQGVEKYITTNAPVFEKDTWVSFRFEADTSLRRYHVYIDDVCVSADGNMSCNGEPYSTWLGLPYVKYETSTSRSLKGYRISLSGGKHALDSRIYLDDMYMKKQNLLPETLTEAMDAFEREFLSANKLDAVTDNLIIPNIPSNILECTHYSDNTAVISTDGIINRRGKDVRVTFSTEYSLGSDKIRRDYLITVKAMGSGEAAQKDLDAAIASIKAAHNLGAVTDNISLGTAEFGSTLKITHSSNEDAVSLSGIVTRGDSDKTVTITITSENGGDEKSETIALTIKQKAVASTTTSYESTSTVPTVSGHSSNAGGGGSSGIEIKPIEKPKMSFNDLSSSHWAYEAVKELWEDGIVKGVSENSFEPERSVTREEFAKLLACTTDISPKNKDIAFSDVPESRWSYQYIRTLATNGIINGQSDGYFGACENVSRQDMAVMIYRALKAKGITPEKVRSAPTFTDSAQISDYAREAVNELYSYGIINGVYEWEFAPNASATRAQAAKILYALIEKIN